MQVKAQADKDVANYEAEWRQLTDIVEQDRRSREAQRQRDIAAREQQMAALFKQDSSCGAAAGPAGKRGSRASAAGAAGRTPPGSSGGSAGADCSAKATDVAAATAPERVRQLKEAFNKVLAATGEQQGWRCCLLGGCLAQRTTAAHKPNPFLRLAYFVCPADCVCPCHAVNAAASTAVVLRLVLQVLPTPTICWRRWWLVRRPTLGCSTM